MSVVCHVGNPKAWSTSLQTLLDTEAGDDYRYLGLRPGRAVDEWFERPEVAELLDLDLRFTSSRGWNEKLDRHRRWMGEIVDSCARDRRQLWLSSETLASRFLLQDIDPLDKLGRLQAVVEHPITFVVVLRNVWSSLESVYLEFLKGGYTLDFEQFCDETLMYRDANFLDSLLPGRQLDLLQTASRPEDRLRWHALHDHDTAPDELIGFLDGIRERGRFGALPRAHPARARGRHEAMRRLNERHRVVVDATGLVETHRAHWHLGSTPPGREDDLRWHKLRRQHEVLDLAPPCDGAVTRLRAADTALGDHLRSIQGADRALFESIAGPGDDHPALWEVP